MVISSMLGEKLVEPNCNTPVWPEPSLTCHAGHTTHPLNSVKYMLGFSANLQSGQAKSGIYNTQLVDD